MLRGNFLFLFLFFLFASPHSSSFSFPPPTPSPPSSIRRSLCLSNVSFNLCMFLLEKIRGCEVQAWRQDRFDLVQELGEVGRLRTDQCNLMLACMHHLHTYSPVPTYPYPPCTGSSEPKRAGRGRGWRNTTLVNVPGRDQ